MKHVVNLVGEDTASTYERLRSMPGVEIVEEVVHSESENEDIRPMTEEESKEGFRRAFTELAEVLAGRKKARPARDILDELSTMYDDTPHVHTNA